MQETTFAKSNDKLTNFLCDKVEKAIEKRIFTKKIESYNTGEITECDRRLLYRAYNVNAGNKNFECTSLKYLKEKWRDIFISIKDIGILSSDEIVTHLECNLIGTIDFILEIGNKNVICNIVSGNNECSSTRKDIVDIMLKMWIIDVKHGILVYDNNNAYKIYHITPYEPIIRSVCKKCIDLENVRITGKVAPRQYDVYSDECRNCEYSEKCWKE